MWSQSLPNSYKIRANRPDTRYNFQSPVIDTNIQILRDIPMVKTVQRSPQLIMNAEWN